jgi:hypothetical protein
METENSLISKLYAKARENGMNAQDRKVQEVISLITATARQSAQEIAKHAPDSLRINGAVPISGRPLEEILQRIRTLKK